MSLEAGMKDGLHLRPGDKKLGNALGILRLLFKAQRQGRERAERQPGFHGADDRARQCAPAVDFFDNA
jgi:hypothetical protein